MAKAVPFIFVILLLNPFGSKFSTKAAIPVDKAAHFGASYAINDTLYRACTAIEGPRYKWPCFSLSTMLTLSIGLAWESYGNQDEYDILANVGGVTLHLININF